MKAENCRNSKVFSLIELIIAIAVLVILTGILAPQFMKYIEKSRKAVCDSNIDEMLKLCDVYFIELDKSLTENDNILKAVKQVVADAKAKCPSGGTYVPGLTLMKQPQITCSTHDLEKDPTVRDSEKIYSEMLDFTGQNKSDIEKVLKDYYGKYVPASNDNLRQYLLDKEYGNTWPVLDKDLLARNGITNTLYIMPYLDVVEKDLVNTTNNNVTVYASSKTSGYYVPLIYNPEEKKWYKSPKNKSISIANLTWPEIKEAMNKAGWVKLE